MENYIRVGIGVMILNGNKILLGHRAKNKKDTGGIFEVNIFINFFSTIYILY